MFTARGDGGWGGQNTSEGSVVSALVHCCVPRGLQKEASVIMPLRSHFRGMCVILETQRRQAGSPQVRLTFAEKATGPGRNCPPRPAFIRDFMFGLSSGVAFSLSL